MMIALFIMAFSIDAKAQEAQPSDNDHTCCVTACTPDMPCDSGCCVDRASCPVPQGCCSEMAAMCSSTAAVEGKDSPASADAEKHSCKVSSACCSSGEPAKKA